MEPVITKEIKYVNDPNNLSALQKIHEMSTKAKQRKARKSPTHFNHIHVDNIDKNQDEGSHFSRRKNHFQTMKYPDLKIKKQENITKDGGFRINNQEKEVSKGYKSNYNRDKYANKLSEIKSNINDLDKIDEIEENVETKKNEIKPKQYEKGEILKKLKDYKKSQENNSGKKQKVVYETKDEDKNVVGSKNIKIYKKVTKDENGQKIIIKKVVEEVTESNNNDKLVFDDSDDEDEDIEKEFIEEDNSKNKDTKDMKYQIIKEKFDPQGNKIYSKEIFTNKLPK